MPGLFHRAILMSGSSFSSWSLVEDPVHYAVKVANSLNCTVPTNMMKNHQDIVKCLREKPLSDIMSVDVKAPSFLTAMGPSRDGVLIPSDFGTSSIHIRFIKFSSSFLLLVFSLEHCILSCNSAFYILQLLFKRKVKYFTIEQTVDSKL